MLKGNLVIGQSGGPTPVINASLAGVLRASRQRPEIRGVFGLVHGIEGALKEELFDLGQETDETIASLAHTPASILGSCRHKLKDEEYERILDVFRAHDVRHFVYIGGNDSMDTCQKISELTASTGYEMQVVGVPKTIDNDLAFTDHCPGFGSAARFVALAARDTGRDMEAMATFEDVTILETMGRNAGWLAAAAVLARENPLDAPHLVYVPEIPFDEAQFFADVLDVHRRQGFVFVAVSEGLRDSKGVFIGPKTGEGGTDAFGHRLNTFTKGVAAYLADRVSAELRLRARFLRPVLIGRAFTACVAQTDRQEAYRAGQEAVRLLAEGRTEYMVTFQRVSNDPYQIEMGKIPLTQAANAEKLLPREYVNAVGNGILPEFNAYALPLVDGPFPSLARLKGVRLQKRTQPV